MRAAKYSVQPSFQPRSYSARSASTGSPGAGVTNQVEGIVVVDGGVAVVLAFDRFVPAGGPAAFVGRHDGYRAGRVRHDSGGWVCVGP